MDIERSVPTQPAGPMGSMLPSPAREVQQGTVREAAESFASYLFAQVFSQMRPDPSDEEEGGLFSGEQSGMFMDFFDQAIAKRFIGHGGNSLVEQLVGQLSPKDSAANSKPPAP